MKNNSNNGFTLIELLAVIVILAIIMVIAVPQILNVIDNSRNSAWNSNIKMIEEGIELGKTLTDSDMSTETFDINTICNDNNTGDITDSISKVADISKDDTAVKCGGKKGFVIISPAYTSDSGGNTIYKGQFKSRTSVTRDCSSGSCKEPKSEN